MLRWIVFLYSGLVVLFRVILFFSKTITIERLSAIKYQKLIIDDNASYPGLVQRLFFSDVAIIGAVCV